MIKFNGIDRIYEEYSWRITRKAKEVWKSGIVVSTRHTEDSYLDQFEKSVAKYTKRKYGIAVGSGTDALYFALRAKGIGPGKTVLCPAISYLASAEAIKRTGALIQFVDVDENGLMGDIPMMGPKVCTCSVSSILLLDSPTHANQAHKRMEATEVPGVNCLTKMKAIQQKF